MWSSIPAAAPEVQAPIRKEWPLKCWSSYPVRDKTSFKLVIKVERVSGLPSTSEFTNRGEDGAAPILLLVEMYSLIVVTGNSV